MKKWFLILLVPFVFACTASDQAIPTSIELADPSASESVQPEFENSPGNCSEITERSFQRITSSQMDAFSNSDFEGAYALTSERFKRGFTLERFTMVISEYYPSLLDNTEFQAIECLEMGFTGFYEINVRSLSGDIKLRYRFEYVGDRWFIAGAEEIAEDTSQVPA